MSDSINVQTLFAIRDARGLTKYEKLFLFTVESRGVLYTSLRRTAEDMGVSESTVIKAIRSLKEKGLLVARSKRGADGGARPTEYRVDRQALESWATRPKDGTLAARDLLPADDWEVTPETGGATQEAVPGTAVHTTSGYDRPSKETSKENPKTRPEGDREDELKETTLTQRESRLDRDHEKADDVESLDLQDIRLVIQVGVLHGTASTLLAEVTTDDEETFSIFGGPRMSEERLVRHLAYHRDVLGELIRQLPVAALNEAFDIGLEDYMYEVQAREIKRRLREIE